MCGGGGGGAGILRYYHKYIRRGQFWGVQKNEYFGDMKKLWIFLGGH